MPPSRCWTKAERPPTPSNRSRKKIGRDSNYIYRRLKFRQLPQVAREALLSGVIGTAVAGCIARIPSETQREEAAQRIIKPDFQDSPLSTRQTLELISRDYMRELKRAPFDQDDASLVPHMGACGPCKFRTGNAPAVFGDVVRGDICTYPECFRLKVEAIWTRATAAAKAEGKRVLTAVESERLFNDEGKLEWNSDYVRIGDQPTADLVVATTRRLPTWKHLLGKSSAQVEILVARTPRGAVQEIALLKDALAAARLAQSDLFIAPRGQAAPARAPIPQLPATPAAAPSAQQEELPEGNQSYADAEAEKQRAARLQTRIDVATLKAVVEELVQGIESEEGAEPSTFFWTSLLPLVVAHAGKEGCSFVAERRSLDASIFAETPMDAASLLEQETSTDQLPALVAELLLGQYLRYQGGENSPLLAPLLETYQIDAKAIRKRVEAAHKAPKTKKEKPDALS